ncbi:putative ribosomal protein L1p/L10e family protein [Lyophyllum shimeji]|uniref:Ribosomal protein L1p/L10e family protein n=1 Tax=Lyophyllum shimeji TaxID=47721 RepID=A0A9P3PKX0_LYOSH|nr:putative ribosomal protein L1p/L10e family protein [Lyophyllum shimeji]
MARTELIDEKVSADQCKRAIEALRAHELKKEQERQESELLSGKEPNIWLNVTVKKMPSGHKLKPVKIPVAYPLIDPRMTPICLITKDPQREYKDLLETHKIKFISRVVGIEKLKGKFKPFEARRMLLKENGMFLADERIIPLLPKLLGVKWFEAKKQPIPVCLTRKDLKGELERAVSSTYMNQNRGTCTSVKIATLSQSPTQILANLKLALPAIAKHISGGWENIQSLHIKTNSSVSLPIWACNLDEAEGGRWAGLTVNTDEEVSDAASEEEEEGEDEAGEDEAGDEEEEAMVIDKGKDLRQGKGKKRTQEDEDIETPQKKAKGAKGQAMTQPAALTAKTPASTSTSGSSKSGPVKSPEMAAPQKSKTRKSLESEVSAAATPTVEHSVNAAEPSAALSAKKRSKKPASTSDFFSHKPDTQTPATDEPATKAASKKKNATETVPKSVATSVPATTVVAETNASKKKKARLSNGQASDPLPKQSIEESLPKQKKEKSAAQPAGPVVDKSLVKGVKTGKKSEKVVEAPAEKADVTSLTKDELKQKRSAAPGEKKKGKINSTSGKSAKDRVLGKKAAQ